MKASLDELAWAFIQVAIILVFVTWAINPIFKSLELAQQNSAKLNAQEIAGVINTMKASQSNDMTYTANLPAVKCTIEISGRFVKFDITASGKRQSVVMDIIQTPVKVFSNEPLYDCSRKRITIEKQNNFIRIR